VTIDGDEFKYTTTASTDHQSLASELSQAIDGDSKYTATVENNVIKIHTGAGTSSMSATKAGALTEVSGDPPTEALTVENPKDIDVAIYTVNAMNYTSYINTIENIYSDDLNMKTKKFTEEFDGSDPSSNLIIFVLPTKITSDEIESLQKHLDSGGRIFFVAEHDGFAASNSVVSNAIKTLGGSIAVQSGQHNDNTHDRVGRKNLNNSPINAGVNVFQTATYASLEIDPNISQAVIISDNDNIVVADQALSNGRITLIADINFTQLADVKIFLSNLAIDAYNNQKKVQEGINPNENFAPTTGIVETIYSSIVNFDIVGQTLTIKSTNEKIGKEIQFESQSDGLSKVEFKDEKLFVTYNKGVSTTEEIVALINAYPEFTATTTGNIIIP
jgi:hypothetical protein